MAFSLQADQHCKSTGMQIVGYYQANELSDDRDLGPFGKKIAQKIRAQCANVAVLLVRPHRTRVKPSYSIYCSSFLSPSSSSNL